MADKKWDEMMSDWQSCKIAKVDNLQELEDIKKLEAKTHRKARSMNFFMWADILSAMFVGTVAAYQLINTDDLFKQIIFTGGFIIIAPMVFLSVWLRRGAWRSTGNDTKAYIELALKRSVSAIKLAKANAIVAIIAAPFIITVILWRGFSLEAIEWPWNRYIFGSILQFTIFSGMYFGARYYQKRKEVEYTKLRKMLDELKTDN